GGRPHPPLTTRRSSGASGSPIGEDALAIEPFSRNLAAPSMRSLLRSKIHLATVTEANVDYVGSITIDQDLLRAVGLWDGEKVLVVSTTTGARLETYVIEGAAGSGVIGINGAAAHLINAGEKVIIMGF